MSTTVENETLPQGDGTRSIRIPDGLYIKIHEAQLDAVKSGSAKKPTAGEVLESWRAKAEAANA